MPLINMSEAVVYEALPKDVYDAHLDEWEYVDEEDSGSGNPYVKMVFAIDHDDSAIDGRKLTRNFTAQASGLGFFKRALIALGANPEVVSEDFDTDDVLPDLVGNPCRLSVTQRTYEGELQNDIRRVLPVSDEADDD